MNRDRTHKHNKRKAPISGFIIGFTMGAHHHSPVTYLAMDKARVVSWTVSIAILTLTASDQAEWNLTNLGYKKGSGMRRTISDS